MLYRSKNGRYHLEIAPDGAIRVKPRDWLSKYSRAIYGNYWTIDVFRRKDESGRLIPIWNPNLLYAGETIYHLPTYLASREIQETEFTPPVLLSDFQKKKLILESTKEEFHLRGDVLENLDRLALVVHTAGELGEIAEVFGVLSEGLAEFGSVVCAPALPVEATISILNAGEAGNRFVGLKAVAYGITAWAFGDASPPAAPAYLGPTVKPAMVQRAISADPGSARLYRDAEGSSRGDALSHQKAWNDACRSAWNNMEALAAKKKVGKRGLQAFLQASGNWNRSQLVTEIMRELERKYLGSEPASSHRAFWADTGSVW